MASELAGEDGDVANYISKIVEVRGARGGKFIEDKFEVSSTDLVERIVGEFNVGGHGALIFREIGTAVMLVPPLEFTFKSQRSEDGKSPTQLHVTGHFMCLVDRKGKKGPRWAFDDDRAEYGSANKLAYKKAVAAAMHKFGDNVVPAHLLEFVSVLK